MTGQYILDENREPQLETNLIAWGNWMNEGDRRIALDKSKKCCISTVFLGLDHSFGGDIPVLYETLVDFPSGEEEMYRYETEEQAIEKHTQLVKQYL